MGRETQNCRPGTTLRLLCIPLCRLLKVGLEHTAAITAESCTARHALVFIRNFNTKQNKKSQTRSLINAERSRNKQALVVISMPLWSCSTGFIIQIDNMSDIEIESGKVVLSALGLFLMKEEKKLCFAYSHFSSCAQICIDLTSNQVTLSPKWHPPPIQHDER